MPIVVEEDARLAEIAIATIGIARERGVAAINIRAVASAMGGTPPVVTHYLASRDDLIANALGYLIAEWETARAQEVGKAGSAELLHELVRFDTAVSDNDPVADRLFLEFLARARGVADQGPVRAAAKRDLDLYERAADGAGARDPAFVAEVLQVMLRGLVLAMMLEPGQWSAERMRQLVIRVADAVAVDGSAADR